MTIVTELSWEEVAEPTFGAARAAWREAVAQIASKAKEKLPAMAESRRLSPWCWQGMCSFRMMAARWSGAPRLARSPILWRKACAPVRTTRERPTIFASIA